MNKPKVCLWAIIFIAALTIILVSHNPATILDESLKNSHNTGIPEIQKMNSLKIKFALYELGNLAILPNKFPSHSNIIDVPNVQKNLSPKIEFGLSKLIHPEAFVDLNKLRAIGVYPAIDIPGTAIEVVVESVIHPEAAATGVFLAANLVRNQIEALGGRYEISHENLIQCQMPLASIEALAQGPLVTFIRRPYRPKALAVTSEGVAKTGANKWQSVASYRTGGVKPKIAVLDLGFSGYGSKLGSELPPSVTVRSFRADNNLTPNQIHGTACAEIVYDMCPDVNLYLVNFSTDVEQHNAVDWLISEGVQIISYSIGWTNAGDGRGTGPICEDVKKAADRGIIWASSAGNSAEEHWEGTFSSADGDSWHNYSGSDEINSFYVYKNNSVGGFLNWDDWGTWNGTDYGGSNNDYDFWLYIYYSGSWHLVDWSAGWQTGWQWPIESIGYWYANFDTYWGFAISKFDTTRNCKLEIFVDGNDSLLRYYSLAGSLGIPADAPGALAVGATDWNTDVLHYYSSRGPTHDGRNKPDFSAPSGVSTASYGATAFYGTSASAPHLAGAFGLMKDKTPYSLSDITKILQSRAVYLGDANLYGIGRLSLEKK